MLCHYAEWMNFVVDFLCCSFLILSFVPSFSFHGTVSFSIIFSTFSQQITYPSSKLMTAGVRRLIEFLLLWIYDKWFASCNQWLQYTHSVSLAHVQHKSIGTKRTPKLMYSFTSDEHFSFFNSSVFGFAETRREWKKSVRISIGHTLINQNERDRMTCLCMQMKAKQWWFFVFFKFRCASCAQDISRQRNLSNKQTAIQNERNEGEREWDIWLDNRFL